MSPLTLRRFRAERLLRQEFGSLRGRVLIVVRGRLRARGVALDPADLEACYAHAWQGLYAAMLAGQEIANPAGWLMLVTFRRAIEEHRARRRLGCEEPIPEEPGPGEPARAHALAAASEPDLAAALDDRLQLRRLFEGLRGRLSAREREAAVLCYLQGLTRAEAAARMGLSETRMRKLMEGPGGGRPGVAGKVAALATAIRDGDWCDQQGSLMRGLAFGVLDPAGERYRLALMHRDQCPACRAYVLSLRGLAAALPPAFLPLGLGAGALGLAGTAVRAGGAPAGGGVAAGASAGGGAAGASTGGAAAGGAAAGGGWVALGSPLGAKLAVGCLLAVGVGAGCVALGGSHLGGAGGLARGTPGSGAAGPLGSAPAAAPAAIPPAAGAVAARAAGAREAAASAPTAHAPRASTAPAAARQAAREFTLEQPAGSGAAAEGAGAGGGALRGAAPAVAAGLRAPPPAAGSPTAAGEAKAQREFAPG